MVDVSEKAVTTRTAVAQGFVSMKPGVVRAVRRLKNPKGNPLEVARIAGIAAAKRTAEWIPLCHPLALTHIDVTARLCQNGVEVRSEVTATAQTGVEMEALVAVTAAALTVYDMCKALDKGMEISGVVLVEKTGGKSGDYFRRTSVASHHGNNRKKHDPEPGSMSVAGGKTVKLLVADDNPLVRDLVVKGMEPYCEVETASDGADALLKVIDTPPDVILCDYKMPGLDGRQLFEKLHGREATRHIPFLFMASRADIEERLRPLVEGVEDFVTKPFLVKDLVRITKKVVDRLHLEKLQKRASRPGVIQGRLEEMSMIDLMQSLEMGQKSCRLVVNHDGEQGELYFANGQCRDAKIGKVEGDDAVYRVVLWTAGEFEIDFNAANASTRTTTTRNTTGLLMEAMRLMDEASRDTVETK
jgi:cyclic pyranopterin phosphate synthase